MVPIHFLVRLFLLNAVLIYIVAGVNVCSEEHTFSDDPLIELVKNDLAADGDFNYHTILVSLAKEKNIAGMDTTFLADYSPFKDKLPNYLVEYLNREVKNPKALSLNDTEYLLRMMGSYCRFTETGDLSFLHLATESNLGYVLNRVDAPSPLYERYIHEQIEELLAKVPKFHAEVEGVEKVRHGITVVGGIDLLIRAAIIYNNVIVDERKSLDSSCPFPLEYLYPVWVFTHSDIFHNNLDSKRWQNFAPIVGKDINTIFDGKFCAGHFCWIAEIFLQGFKGTKYAKQIKALIGDEKEWQSFLTCCERAHKANEEFEAKKKAKAAAMTNERVTPVSKVKDRSKDKKNAK